MSRKKSLKGDLIFMFKKLPEAGRVPEIVWTAQNQLNRMTEIKNELAALREDFTWNTTPKMITVLKEDWSIKELKEVGFLT